MTKPAGERGSNFCFQTIRAPFFQFTTAGDSALTVPGRTRRPGLIEHAGQRSRFVRKVAG
jgi:hypothetical protein